MRVKPITVRQARRIRELRAARAPSKKLVHFGLANEPRCNPGRRLSGSWQKHCATGYSCYTQPTGGFHASVPGPYISNNIGEYMRHFTIGSKRSGLGSRRASFQSPVIRRKTSHSKLQRTVLFLIAVAIVGCSENRQADVATGRSLGANSAVGNGLVSTYAEFNKDGTPRAIGLVFQASALDGLPTAHSDGHYCFDRNKDGKVDLQTECFGSHEWIIPLPSDAARRSEIPLNGWGSTGTRMGISLPACMISRISTSIFISNRSKKSWPWNRDPAVLNLFVATNSSWLPSRCRQIT